MNDLARRRLFSQRLTGEPLTSPVEVVRWFGAVQSQDCGGAKWALAQRTRAATDTELDRLLDSGRILRTHLLRPTWHFVLPEDVRWLLELTGPRVRQGIAGRHRRLEIDAATVVRAERAMTDALARSHPLNRNELGAVLTASGLSVEGQRLPHLILAAELDGLIASGPRRGRELTYALLDERAPAAPSLDREAALRELALRFFRGHGPAKLSDLTWWSSLTTVDARAGIAAAGSLLQAVQVNGEQHWMHAAAGTAPPARGAAHLLPNFDEYTVGYRDRAGHHGTAPFDPAIFSFGSILANVLTVGGLVRGTWRRRLTSRELHLEIRLLDRLTAAERRAVESAGSRFAAFHGRTLGVAWA